MDLNENGRKFATQKQCEFLKSSPLRVKTFYDLFIGKLEAWEFWTLLGVDIVIGLAFGAFTLCYKRTVREAMLNNDLVKAKKQFKKFFGFPFVAALFVCYLQASAP